jgi:NAD(P)-dependent dehydrogenase (short-subunit alcohol dehydrogenase family)
MSSWEGYAVVTGGGSGIGMGICMELARRGTAVAVVDIDGQKAADVAKDIRDGGAAADSYQVDVFDQSAVESLVRDLNDAHGTPWLVFSNAGVIARGSFLELDNDTWNWVLGINLLGAVNVVRAFLPSLISEPAPTRIAVTGSMNSLRGSEHREMTIYTASKFAVLGMTESLRPELAGTGVGLTTVFPGPVRTSLVAGSARLRAGADAEIPERTDTDRAREGHAGTYLDPEDAGRIIVDGVLAGHDYVATHADLWYEVEQVQQRVAAAFGHALQARPI